MTGTVYTETLIHSAPEAFVSEAPYQLIIVTLDNGKRITGRVAGERVAIDDAVDPRRRAQRRSLFPKNHMKLAARMDRILIETAFEVLVKARALEARDRASFTWRSASPTSQRRSMSSKPARKRSTRGGRTTVRRRDIPISEKCSRIMSARRAESGSDPRTFAWFPVVSRLSFSRYWL